MMKRKEHRGGFIFSEKGEKKRGRGPPRVWQKEEKISLKGFGW